MSASILGNLLLGYQLVWDTQRRPRGVHLRVEATVDETVDAAHLLRILAESWSGTAPQLILHTPEPWLVREFVQHADARSPWIAVGAEQAAAPGMEALLQAAAARGAQLLWRGSAGADAPAGPGPYSRKLLALTASDVQDTVLADQVCENPPTLALAQHALDAAGAWGVSGWPEDDVLRAGRQQQALPDRAGLQALIAAVDADAALDRLEQIMDTQPVLAYRFLLYLGSTAAGKRNPAESLRHGLMMLGMRNLRTWLEQQMAEAGDDPDLWPVRRPLVLRAELTATLMDAGEHDLLRRELYLCALLAGIPRMLGEPIQAVLERFELSERITSSLLSDQGPYAVLLALSDALGSHTRCATVPALCKAQELDLADVNRVLLRTLAQLHARAPGTPGTRGDEGSD